jgi:predicted MPP superfamily phosphohydrolase
MTHKIAETFGTEYFAGPYRIEHSFLYISRGLGSASWPLRIRALPELTFFELQHGTRPRLELIKTEICRIDPLDD